MAVMMFDSESNNGKGGQCGKINQTVPVIQEGPKSSEFLKILYTNSDTLTNKMDELKTINSS